MPTSGHSSPRRWGGECRRNTRSTRRPGSANGSPDRARTSDPRLDLVQLHCPPTAVIEDDSFSTSSTRWWRGAHRRLRSQRGDMRPGAHGDRAPQHRDRADHPQRLPAEAARARAPGRPGGGCRHHRAGPARERAALRPLHHETTSPPTITAPTTATARRSTSARRSPASTSKRVSRRSGASRRAFPTGATMAQWALRWVLDQPGVSVVIPGARNARAGPRKRRRSDTSAALGRRPRGRAAGLRRPDPPIGARALVKPRSSRGGP